MVLERMPAAEVTITSELVGALLTDQQPDLAQLPLTLLTSGWDNAIYRLGDHYVVRLPRRELAADLIRTEQRWLPALAARVPLPVPEPLRIGRPGHGYPWWWTVAPYFAGRSAAMTPPDDPHEAAVTLGGFLGALHSTAPPDAPANTYRGVPLIARTDDFAQRLHQLREIVDVDLAHAAWQAGLSAPPYGGDPVWLHGDFHPANIVVDGGRVSAVIDFGDLTSGDPATDLAIAWMLLPTECRAEFRSAYDATSERGSDDDTWVRARAWALGLALAFVSRSADNPLMASVGLRTFDAVLASL